MIRVVISDDHALVRAGLREVLHSTQDIRVAAEASDGEEALLRIREQRPDAALLDVRMPRLGGIEVLERLAGDMAVPPAVMLTTFDDSEAMARALRAGARAFLTKHATAEQLIDAVRTVAAGGTYFKAVEGAHAPPTAHARTDHPAPEEPLTHRELQVLQLMSRGFSNREVAVALGIAEGTAKNVTSTVIAKLGVRDRTRAVLRGLQLGLLR